MKSGKTPRDRQPGPAAESGSNATSDGAAVSDQPGESSVEPAGSADESRHLNSSGDSHRRVTAAGTAAGAAASGSATSKSARATSSARVESDAAVAAASAAAAAAVAAVSAAIAATAATRATDAATTTARPAPAARKRQVAAAGAAAPKPAPGSAPKPELKLAAAEVAAVVAPTVEPKAAHAFPVFAAPSFPATRAGHVPAAFSPAPAPVPAPAPLAVAPAAAETLQPSCPGFVGGKHPDLPIHAGLTRFEDIEPPIQPGITPAGSSEVAPEIHLVSEPLFSNEGIVRRSSANYRNIFQRVIAIVGAIVAALAAAGTALGHSVVAHLPTGRSAVTAAPENLGGASVVDLPPSGPKAGSSGVASGRLGGSSAAAGLTSALVALRAGLALTAGAVAGAVKSSVRRIGGRGPAAQLVPVEAGDYPTERRRRRVPVFWLFFAGFFVVLYCAAVLGGWVLPSMASSSSDPSAGGTATPVIAGGDPTATEAVTVTPGGTVNSTGTAANPTPSASPSAKPTVKPAPKPTAKPTAKPKPKPTPKPTPVDFVTFYAQGASDGTNTANYTMAKGTHYNVVGHLEVIIKSRGTSSCTLSANGATSGTLTVSGASSQTTGSAEWVPHAAQWAAGNYTVTASCTLNGFTATATTTITIA